MFQGPLTESIIQRAQERGRLDLHLHDLRAFGRGRYRQVDDSPYGGGVGMVMRADVLVPAMEAVQETRLKRHKGLKGHRGFGGGKVYRVCLSAGGKRLMQATVERLAKKPWLLLLCGHYEGIDQRVVDGWIDEEISIGDYVLTGGELPAMVLIDAVARQIPGVLGKEESAEEESFSRKLSRKREYPHYTRPEEFRGMRVPQVLLSGNHAEIARWRKQHLQ